MNFLNQYKTILWDCDGVILDSNAIKTDAFYETTLEYGKEVASALRDYHMENGGISRLVKFKYFFEKILKRQDYQNDLESLLKSYAKCVEQKLFACAETEGLRECLESVDHDVAMMVISGGLQSELREVFAVRNLASYFVKIYGSPDTKAEIIARELKSEHIKTPALFIGDSRYDYEQASKFGFDVIFMYEYTEFYNYKDYFRQRDVRLVANPRELMALEI